MMSRSVEDIMEEFHACDHAWIPQDEESPFYDLCASCGAAQGLRFPEWLLL